MPALDPKPSSASRNTALRDVGEAAPPRRRGGPRIPWTCALAAQEQEGRHQRAPARRAPWRDTRGRPGASPADRTRSAPGSRRRATSASQRSRNVKTLSAHRDEAQASRKSSAWPRAGAGMSAPRRPRSRPRRRARSGWPRPPTTTRKNAPRRSRCRLTPPATASSCGISSRNGLARDQRVETQREPGGAAHDRPQGRETAARPRPSGPGERRRPRATWPRTMARKSGRVSDTPHRRDGSGRHRRSSAARMPRRMSAGSGGQPVTKTSTGTIWSTLPATA